MKLNKLRKRQLVTLALVGAGFLLGNESGKQTILERWENRWFDSEWYDYRSVEDILKNQAYWER
tara:strand:- start:328 stop:519 length:192 start_codon:yes stop_codon:yes gene_type:complete